MALSRKKTWRAPRPLLPTMVKFRTLLYPFLIGVLITVGVFLRQGPTWFYTPPPPPPLPSARPLTPLENLGLAQSANKLLTIPAFHIVGSSSHPSAFKGRRIYFDVKYISYTRSKLIKDKAIGTLSTHHIDAQFLRFQGTEYINASPQFWRALDIDTKIQGWIVVHRFLEDDMTYPVKALHDTILSGLDTTILDNTITIGDSSITLDDKGSVNSYSSPTANFSITATPTNEVLFQISETTHNRPPKIAGTLASTVDGVVYISPANGSASLGETPHRHHGHR